MELPAARVKGRRLPLAAAATVAVLLVWALSWGSDDPVAFQWVQPSTAPSTALSPDQALALRLNPAPGSDWVIDSYAVGPQGRVSWRPQAVGGSEGELVLKTQLRRDLGPPGELSSAVNGPWRLLIRLSPRHAAGSKDPNAPPPKVLELELALSSSASAVANPL